MKILYVDLQYDYGVQSRGPNNIGQKGFKAMFEKLGHQVIPFYYDSYLNRLDELQGALLSAAREIKPDLAYFILFQDQFKSETLDELKKITKTVNWFGDDPWRFNSFTSRYAPHFTINITTDPFALPKYEKLGLKAYLSQWAAIEDTSTVHPADYLYDVSFVGSFNNHRKWFIDTLRSRGLKIHTFGYGWEGGVLSHEKMIECFQRSKINLNLSNSVSHDIRFITGGLRNLKEFLRSPKTASQIKARNFEIPYYGGFQLADYVPGLEHYLEIGQDIACYKDVDEAELMIRFYLDNNELREKQKTRSFEKCRNAHTYFHRHRDFFEAHK